jgi:SAM-dependent methyltransferase
MYRIFLAMVAAIGLMIPMASGRALAQAAKEAVKEAPKEAPAKKEFRSPDVIYVPTPHVVVEKMLDMAKVKKGDVVYDLGCGDGRIVVAAAKRGAKATGWDIDPVRVGEAKENVKKNKVEENAKIIQDDIFTLDLSRANVITLYLLPGLNVKLIPQLEKLKPGSRIVSHDFDMAGVKPDEVVEVEVKGDGDGDNEEGYGFGGRSHTVYLWTTPLKKEKP